MRCDADAVHASKSTLNKMPRRRLLVGGVATAFLTIASALQPALRVRTPALARVTRPPVASAYTVLRAAENDDDTVAVEDEEAASDEADEAVEAEETVDEEEEEEEGEDPNAEIKAEIAQLEAQLKEKRLELSRANGAAAEAWSRAHAASPKSPPVLLVQGHARFVGPVDGFVVGRLCSGVPKSSRIGQRASFQRDAPPRLLQ